MKSVSYDIYVMGNISFERTSEMIHIYLSYGPM